MDMFLLPNRMRFEELSNFDYFTVKGTKVQVCVKEWSQEAEAVGKLHIVWVKVSGIPDEMKNYQALFEVGSNLGPAMEVDMVSCRSTNVVRIKVGMMDLETLPLKLILTTPKGFLYQAVFTLEEILEQGWFKEECFEEVQGKKESKENSVGGTNQREGKQIVREDCGREMELQKEGNVQKKETLSSDCLFPELMMKEDKRKCFQILKDRELAIQLQATEADEEEQRKSHTHDQIMSGSLKRKTDSQMQTQDDERLDGDDSGLKSSIGAQMQKHSEQKKVCDTAGAGLSGNKLNKSEVTVINAMPEPHEEDKEKVDLGESEEFMDSQESEDNFARQVGVVMTEEENESQEEEKRRSKSLKDKEDRNLQELAIERKEAQNAFINKGQDQIPSFIHDSNIDLVNIASLLGVNLGCALDEIDANLNLVKDLELARINLFVKEHDMLNMSDGESKSGVDFPDEKFLSEMYSSEENISDSEEFDKLLKNLTGSGSKKKSKRGNLEIVKVTPRLKRKEGWDKRKKKR